MVSTAAFHARVRGSVPGLGGFKETKMFLPHPRVKVSIVGSLRDREVACSASDRQVSNFESCVWRKVSSHSSHHSPEVLLAQFSLYVHKGGLKPDSFHFISIARMEKFVCKLYGSKLEKTDLVRQSMILSSSKPEKMPPTSDALKFHVQIAFVQARIWQCADIAQPDVICSTSPDRGWYLHEGRIRPVLMSMNPIPLAVREIISCQTCKTGCNNMRCNCFSEGLFCTRLCHKKSPEVCKNCP